MKVLNYILVVLVFSPGSWAKDYKIPMVKFGNPLSKMCGAMIIKFFSKTTTHLTITRVEENHDSEIMQSGIINEFLYEVKGSILIRLEGKNTQKDKREHFYNIFVVDSYKSFRQILYDANGDLNGRFDFTGFYTIVYTSIHDDYNDVVQKILDNCYDLYMVNVNLITYDPCNLDRSFIYTYFPYTERHCAQVYPEIFGIYESDNITITRGLFPDKVSNLHLCNLTVGTFEIPPYMMITPQGNGSYYFDGFEGIVTRVLGQRINFSLILRTAEDRWGMVAGENSTGAVGMLLRGEVNFTVGSFSSTFSHYGRLSVSIPYFSNPLLLLIPPGRPYSPVEKLFLPIKYIIWSCICSIFVLSAILVTLSQFWTPNRRIFVFGPHNYYPFLNTFNVFLGGPVHIMPTRNFARYLLLLWIVTSLVIRSSYQGALFSVIKNRRTANSLDTLEKLYRKGYKIYGVEGTRKFFISMTRYISMFVATTAKDIDNFRYKTMYQDFDGAVVTPAINVAYMNEKFATHNIRFQFSKDRVVQLYMSIFFRKYSYLTKPCDTELWKYQESGLIHRWTNIFYNTKFLRVPQEKGEFKALTYDQLSGIFWICILLMSISFLVFILEILSQKCRWIQRLCNFLN
ncbi:hypothetical protein DMENIID0001_157970 [Sergentomyia squamirostris]